MSMLAIGLLLLIVPQADPPAPSPLDGPLVEYTFKPPAPEDEAVFFTPPGFEKVGVPAVARGDDVARLNLVVRDAATGQPTPCRVNVVGPDGDYFEPADGHLKPFSLTGQWPRTGKGNRVEKAPFRYLGRFFYTAGEASVTVPAGRVRVEVWKGFEFRPETLTVEVEAGATRDVRIDLKRAVPMRALGYDSGDPHLHIPRKTEDDDRLIFDLMEAEDIRNGTLLAYNEPAGPYFGFMDRLDSPQHRGLGKASIATRGDYRIVSGQEYRSNTYGHLNLFLLDDLVLREQSINANDWPLYGDLIREARGRGGVAIYAHGGYAQALYADVVQGNVDAVELLQFGVYRGIGLSDWYRMLNVGFRLPAVGACDYPACRKLGDCVTYVHSSEPADIEGWLRGAAAGRSFVTTGPMLLLEVDGQRPGAAVAKDGPGPHTVRARARVRCEVAPVTHLQIVANGRVVAERTIDPAESQGRWIELERELTLDRSAWVAARTFSLADRGGPDAEAHTNPVYAHLDGKAPYEQASLDALVKKLDGQIAAQKARDFAEKARVLAYFDRSRDILMRLRAAGGAPADRHPSDLAKVDDELADPGRRTHTAEELRAYLKPVPPLPIDEVLRTFEAVDGFRMELVAREPLVVDPIAAAFDADGNLYVAEMRDYPYKPAEGKAPIGTIRKLVDRDGDGTFDEGHVFAENLLWAGGVAPWKGGVFVAAPPSIWYLEDTDGDHKADVRREIFTGFGSKNQQAMLNNLQWGLDHKIYGSTAGNGGSIRPAGRPDAAPVEIDGRDFRFDPETGVFEAITGTVQFGNSFDDWGERFLCSESQPLLHAVLPLEYLERNRYLPAPRGVQILTEYPVSIHRISPIERWRQIRSSRRIAHSSRPATAAGASHHVVDAAAGVTIYRGGAYPPQYQGSVFVADAQNNLVHRRTLEPAGVTFASKRAEPEGIEFLRSPDIWFRPVNFVNAPDGTLYLLDMSREVLESIHIPSDVVPYLDLTSGRDRGRIYRIAPPGFRYPGPPRLGQAGTADLVAALESPHGWWRDTAHRLLRERRDAAAIPPLRRLLVASGSPQARLHALWSLQGLQALEDDELIASLRDPSPHVRRHAIRLAETRLDRSPGLLDAALALLDDADPGVRYQLAFSLGESRSPRAAAGLARIARESSADTWIRTAVLSSATELAGPLLADLLLDPGFARTPVGGELVASLASILGARQRPEELGRLFATLATGPVDLRPRLALAAAESLKRAGGRLDAAVTAPDAAVALVTALEAEATRRAADPAVAVEDRRQAIRLLGCLSFGKARDPLAGLLDVRQPEPVQIAALQALAGYPDAEVAPLVLARWREASPAVRAQAIDTLLARDDRALAFLRAIERGEATAAEIDPVRRSPLLNHRDPTLRALARSVLGAGSSTREQVIGAYRPALQRAGDPERGAAVFRRECATCHKLGEVGVAVGPELASNAARDPEALLVNILDPGRFIAPNYVQYQVVDRDGRIFQGMLAAQSATSLTLLREEGKTETILRDNVDELVSSGRSLMPEGLETRVTPPEMADLIAFLRRAAESGEAAATAPLEIGTEPGLIEPDTNPPPASGSQP